MSTRFVEVLNDVLERVNAVPPAKRPARYRSLGPVERDMYVVNCLVCECTGGGFATYFSGSFGRYWADAIDALERIGASEAAGLLRDACASFSGGVPSADPSDLHAQLREPHRRGVLEALDMRFDDVEVMDRLEVYWRAHESS